MLGWWTLGRASGFGVAAALLALLLWPFWGEHGHALLGLFAALAAAAGLCGVSILVITALDMVLHKRGRRVRPVRAFDILLGLSLIGLSLVQLQHAAGQLPA
jgi:uncharacterized membrane protein YbhN (UPF0104 family)